MKTLLLSQSDGGGAGRAARRLHLGLQKIAVESQMLVQVKTSGVPGIVPRGHQWQKLANSLNLLDRVDKVPLSFYRQRERTEFSPQWLPNALATQIHSLNPAVINLHWTGHGFLPIETLSRLKLPLVWTLHDMWAFTGGCHYAGTCDRYTKQCGACPQLHSNREADLSRWIWRRKERAWRSIDLTIVTPSRWLAECARSSTLLQEHRIEVIPNGLDLQIYKPVDRAFARHVLNLPQDRKLILFGAMFGTSDRRKGFHLLQPALDQIRQTAWGNQVDLVVFGGISSQNSAELGFKVHALGRLNDEFSLALAYAAADVFVAPSIEDNLPNTILEASACGTPCVGFQIGGIADLIDHLQTGYLCRPFEVADLVQGMAWILEDHDRRCQLGNAARLKMENQFSDVLQAERYTNLFLERIEDSHLSKKIS
ncbi:glycosyltransferase family 4 protein [Egbenema bharatensis]|uniref:glycosyltransferase family 4 protein n=1 Tax=Egbenema bharatensis TaxID=3463334 RepID=UPI003A8694D8